MHSIHNCIYSHRGIKFKCLIAYQWHVRHLSHQVITYFLNRSAVTHKNTYILRFLAHSHQLHDSSLHFFKGVVIVVFLRQEVYLHIAFLVAFLRNLLSHIAICSRHLVSINTLQFVNLFGFNLYSLSEKRIIEVYHTSLRTIVCL